MKKAYKKLGANISLFSISSFGTKIISFILVPLYTNCLSTAEYGTVDMLTTVVQLLIPIFTLDIADAVIRYSLEKNTNKDAILKIAFKIIALGSALLIAIMYVLSLFNIFKIPFSYYCFLLACYFFTSIYNTMTNYFKGRDKVVDIVIAGILSTTINGVSNIVFLLIMKIGINGYLYANILGVSVPSVYLLIRAKQHGILHFNKDVKNDVKLQTEMLKYCMPLIINGLSWWINNYLDKFFVNAICGISANGLLAVAYKVPSILAMFQTIFNQAWTMSAVQEFDPQDRDGFLAKTYTYYGCSMVLVSGLCIIFNIQIAKIIYAKDFFIAWRYTGFLVLASLVGAMSICISGVFNAVKDSKTLGLSTMLGAVVNTLLNLLLINTSGVLGATLATFISNIAIWAMRMLKVREYVKLRINIGRDLLAYIDLVVMCVVGLLDKNMYLLQWILFVILLLLYNGELKNIFEIFRTKLDNRNLV